jgi:MFS family permease
VYSGLVWAAHYDCHCFDCPCFHCPCFHCPCFPLAGYIYDTCGRKYSGTPAFVLLSLGIACIPFATTLPSLIAVGVAMGLGNGLSSGLVMTTASDLAPPPPELGPFLGE